MSLRVVVDAIPARGMSLGIVIEHLLEGWEQLEVDDQVHLVVGSDAGFEIPDWVTTHTVEFGSSLRMAKRLWAQSVTVPRVIRSTRADVLLGVIPATTVTATGCPKAVIAFDQRYELRPEQFSTPARLLRKVSYDLGFYQAGAVSCISERTRRDLLSSHPQLARKPVGVSLLGADHVDAWPVPAAAGGYALGFGHFANKNVDLILDAWNVLRTLDERLPLVLLGLSPEGRDRVSQRARSLGVADLVSIRPWLSDDEFHAQFAGASLIVYPSDFEGFGLPAVEAMRLGIPVVISPEPALLEVTDGHATVMDGPGPEALAQAVIRARHITTEALEAARRYVAKFTWKATASEIRSMLTGLVEGSSART